MYIGVHAKYALFLSDFNDSSILPKDFRKILKYQILLNPIQWEPSFSILTDGRTDRQKDVTKLIVAFRKFVDAPKMRMQRSS
jgi:hypothetical protein